MVIANDYSVLLREEIDRLRIEFMKIDQSARIQRYIEAAKKNQLAIEADNDASPSD